MSPRYLFPCRNCDYEFELVTKQAGQSLTCPQCQNDCEAPKLGALRQLESVGGEVTSSTSRSGSGSSLRNILFVSGLSLAVLAGVAGYFLYQHAQSMISVFDVEEVLADFNELADQQKASQLIRYYDQMDIPKGLPEWQEQVHVGQNKQANILTNVAYGLFGLAGIGLLMLFGSFLVRK